MASSEEEIDDEEPELVIDDDDLEAEGNVERLAASGISVTVIDKNKQKQQQKQQNSSSSDIETIKEQQTSSSDAVSKTNKESIGLSSDISVTVVHKKKIDVGGSASSTGPKISVKKEAELLVSIFYLDIIFVIQ